MWNLILVVLFLNSVVSKYEPMIPSQPAEDGQLPHQVSVQILFGTKWKHDCSGTILSKIVVGTNDISKQPNVETQVFKVIGYWILKKRLLVLEIARVIHFNQNVSVANLPLNSDDCTLQRNLTFSGWILQNGYLAIESKKLQIATVPTLTAEECNKRLLAFDKTERVSNSSICTESSEINHQVCISDSGAPLVEKNGETYTIYGLLHWTLIPHWNYSYPMVFINICPYIGALNKIITPLAIDNLQRNESNKTLEEEDAEYNVTVNGETVEVQKNNETKSDEKNDLKNVNVIKSEQTIDEIKTDGDEVPRDNIRKTNETSEVNMEKSGADDKPAKKTKRKTKIKNQTEQPEHKDEIQMDNKNETASSSTN